MTKQLQDKFFDVRVVNRYLNKGAITEKDVKNHFKDLPNDQDNFELVLIEEDDIGVGDTLSEEELKSMPAITEENIDNFDFMEKEDEEGDENEAGGKDLEESPEE